MSKFDLINTTNLEKASIGDVFIGYGKDGKGVSLTHKSHDEIGWFACFKEVNKDGSLSVFGFEYINGSLSNRNKL